MERSPVRPFAKPWKIEESGESFQIRDAAGRLLAYVYFDDDASRRNFNKRLTKDDARRGSADIAASRARQDRQGHRSGRGLMIQRAPLELPPEISRRFVEDMRAYFAETDGHKRDEIAARQLHALRGFQPPRERKLRLSDVKEMFEEMRGYIKPRP
jgi:hypothetical protein